jgi:hypothetical protein
VWRRANIADPIRAGNADDIEEAPMSSLPRTRRLSLFSSGILALVAATLVLLPACDGDSGASLEGEPGTIRIALTDAPADYIESAEVVIAQAYVISAEDESRYDVLEPEAGPRTFDLMELRGGLEEFLGEAPVPEDVYSQLRLVVESATVTLIEGETFDDGTTTRELFVPSGSESGIKVALTDPIVAEEGQVTLVVVDFDVNESFVLQGNPETPAGIRGILFKPVLKEKRRESSS